MTKLHEYTVRGRGHFPIDALRAAKAWPSRPKDADRVAMSLLMTHAPRRAYRVTVYSYSLPDVNIWSKFEWEICS